MRGKHRYRRPRRSRRIPADWRRPLGALALLFAGVLFVAIGLAIGELLIVWALFALAALVGGLVLLAGESGPEWPAWPTEHSPYRENAESPTLDRSDGFVGRHTYASVHRSTSR